ncbi:MAG: HEAT repeat domain-containing protein [Polyangiaceae bacterium]
MKAELFVALAVAVTGCGQAKTPAELEAGLDSPDPEVRRSSADGLRDGHDVPSDAIPKLILLTRSEKDPKALGAMLLTLGASGAGAAHDPICQHYDDSDEAVQHYADRAMIMWLKRNPIESGCTGVSTLDQVPKSQGPTPTGPSGPQKRKSWTQDFR